MKSSQSVGNFTLNAQENMQNLREKELVENILLAHKMIVEYTGEAPEMLMFNATVLNEKTLKAAGACGYAYVAEPAHQIILGDVAQMQEVPLLLGSLEAGMLLDVRLRIPMDGVEQQIIDFSRLAVQPPNGGVAAAAQYPTTKQREEANIQAVNEILKVIQSKGFAVRSADAMPFYQE
jgi:hypothetical protein